MQAAVVVERGISCSPVEVAHRFESAKGRQRRSRTTFHSFVGGDLDANVGFFERIPSSRAAPLRVADPSIEAAERSLRGRGVPRRIVAVSGVPYQNRVEVVARGPTDLIQPQKRTARTWGRTAHPSCPARAPLRRSRPPLIAAISSGVGPASGEALAVFARTDGRIRYSPRGPGPIIVVVA